MAARAKEAMARARVRVRRRDRRPRPFGLSRIYLGADNPSDVLGGYALGGLWGAIVLTTDGTLTHQRVAYGSNL
jgi:hypothetical protein